MNRTRISAEAQRELARILGPMVLQWERAAEQTGNTVTAECADELRWMMNQLPHPDACGEAAIKDCTFSIGTRYNAILAAGLLWSVDTLLGDTGAFLTEAGQRDLADAVQGFSVFVMALREELAKRLNRENPTL